MKYINIIFKLGVLILLTVYCVSESSAQNEADTELVEEREPDKDKGKIVGGRPTSIARYPYQVSFVVNGRIFCGGFIISPDYVMTAAHCVQRATPASVRLRVGSTFRDRGGRIVPVANVTVHELYDVPELDNDIAVLRLGQRLVFDSAVRAVRLPPPNARVPLGAVTVTGWGLLAEGGRRVPRQLREVQVPVVWQWLCRLSYREVLTRNMFCAGNYLFGGQDSCQGDSGGPAVMNGIVWGIVSFARGCAQPLFPTVFADLTSLRPWITRNTGL